MIKLKDGSLITSQDLKEGVRVWRQLSRLSESSADALGAIVDLVAWSAAKSALQPGTQFSQESVDILRGVGWWPLSQVTVALVRNAVHLDPDKGVYVWDNPKMSTEESADWTNRVSSLGYSPSDRL